MNKLYIKSLLLCLLFLLHTNAYAQHTDVGSVSGVVWVDEDGDGLRENGEQAYSGLTIRIYKLLNVATLVGEVVTDQNGAYSFSGLTSRDCPWSDTTCGYSVTFDNPEVDEFVYSPINVGGDVAIDSDFVEGWRPSKAQKVVRISVNNIEYLNVDAGLAPIDSDADGVGNAVDQCPDTEVGVSVDINGCSDSQKDTDNDGVNDALDQCSGTQVGAAVDANGCSDVQKDSDSDGVNDAVDQCPGTEIGLNVDEFGCETGTVSGVVWLDADGDGLRENGEQTYPGLTIKIYKLLNVATLVGEVMTDQNGAYSFSDLTSRGCPWSETACGYSITFDNPSINDFVYSPENVGNNVSIDSDFVESWTPSKARKTINIGATTTQYLNIDAGLAPADSDADGVNDALDQCPGTEAGAAVDVDGCSDTQKDTDNDGVNDALDQCPGTEVGAAVDVDGCSDTQKDTDNDGVNDALDQCPGTEVGAAVDVDGCSDAQKDTDNDGVNDALDQCPGTEAGASVDENGCTVGSISGVVWIDDGDGIREPGETMLPGLSITLYQMLNRATLVETVTTAADGSYTFNNLDIACLGVTDCRYSVQFDNPSVADYVYSPIRIGSNKLIDSDFEEGWRPSLARVTVWLSDYNKYAAHIDAGLASISPDDEDFDDVNDGADQCSQTPAGLEVDDEGCSESQRDQDFDSVLNQFDQCPDTALSASVDVDGCSDAQRDDDLDGVANSLDQCPSTIANVDVDSVGCNLAGEYSCSIPSEVKPEMMRLYLTKLVESVRAAAPVIGDLSDPFPNVDPYDYYYDAAESIDMISQQLLDARLIDINEYNQLQTYRTNAVTKFLDIAGSESGNNVDLLNLANEAHFSGVANWYLDEKKAGRGATQEAQRAKEILLYNARVGTNFHNQIGDPFSNLTLSAGKKTINIRELALTLWTQTQALRILRADQAIEFDPYEQKFYSALEFSKSHIDQILTGLNASTYSLENWHQPFVIGMAASALINADEYLLRYTGARDPEILPKINALAEFLLKGSVVIYRYDVSGLSEGDKVYYEQVIDGVSRGEQHVVISPSIGSLGGTGIVDPGDVARGYIEVTSPTLDPDNTIIRLTNGSDLPLIGEKVVSTMLSKDIDNKGLWGWRYADRQTDAVPTSDFRPQLNTLIIPMFAWLHAQGEHYLEGGVVKSYAQAYWQSWYAVLLEGEGWVNAGIVNRHKQWNQMFWEGKGSFNWLGATGCLLEIPAVKSLSNTMSEGSKLTDNAWLSSRPDTSYIENNQIRFSDTNANFYRLLDEGNNLLQVKMPAHPSSDRGFQFLAQANNMSGENSGYQILLMASKIFLNNARDASYIGQTQYDNAVNAWELVEGQDYYMRLERFDFADINPDASGSYDFIVITALDLSGNVVAVAHFARDPQEEGISNGSLGLYIRPETADFRLSLDDVFIQE